MSITVMEVFRAMDIKPDSRSAWKVGGRVSAMYKNHFGVQPPKENRKKSSGTGSHCFAIYPRDWMDNIVKVIDEVTDTKSSQRSLL